MKAKVVYLTMALVLVFSLAAAAIVPVALAPVQASPSWWNTDWEYRQKLTFVQDSGQSGALTDFPVMVRISSSDTNFWSHVRDDGFDVRFLDSDDFTQCDFHFEKFDPVTDLMTAWVEVPSIAAYGTTDYIWLYYGNPSAIADPQNQSGTYDANFKMVQHLEETSGTHYDSTANNNDGTPQGGVSQNAMGKINGADDFDGTDDYVAVTNDASLEPPTDITVSVWARFNDLDRYDQSLIARMHGDGYGIFLNAPEPGHRDTIEFIPYIGTYQPAGFPTTEVDTDNWHYIVGTDDGATVKIFLNGSFKAQNTNPSGAINYTATPDLLFGEDSSGNSPSSPQGFAFDGRLDEVRISDIARSADWIKAQHLSMTDNFITYGSAESAEEEPPPSCFIATAAYGTSTAEEIDTLRAFRDEVLLQNSLGSQFVALYYEVSPPVADFISEHEPLRTLVRELVIDPMVSLAEFTQGIWGD